MAQQLSRSPSLAIWQSRCGPIHRHRSMRKFHSHAPTIIGDLTDCPSTHHAHTASLSLSLSLSLSRCTTLLFSGGRHPTRRPKINGTRRAEKAGLGASQTITRRASDNRPARGTFLARRLHLRPQWRRGGGAAGGRARADPLTTRRHLIYGDRSGRRVDRSKAAEWLEWRLRLTVEARDSEKGRKTGDQGWTGQWTLVGARGNRNDDCSKGYTVQASGEIYCDFGSFRSHHVRGPHVKVSAL